MAENMYTNVMGDNSANMISVDVRRSPEMAHPCINAKETLAKESASFGEIKSNMFVHMGVVPSIAENQHLGSPPTTDMGCTDARQKVSDDVLEDVSINRMPLAYGTPMPIHLDCIETCANTFPILQHQNTSENVDPVLKHALKHTLEPHLHKEMQNNDETRGYFDHKSRDCTERISDVPYFQMSACQSWSSSNTSTSMHHSAASSSLEKHGSPMTVAEHELMEGTWGLVQCPFCTNMYNDPTELLEHQKSHTQEEQFECIDHEVVLAECQEVPGDDKTYQCIVCDRSFSKQSSLMTHLRIHTGEKPFSCHMCQKTFNQRTSLTVHLRTHTGEMPYPCNKCNRSFRQKSNLTHHMKSHTPQGIIRYLNGFEVFNHQMGHQVHHPSVSGDPQWHNPRTTRLVDPSTCSKISPDTKEVFNPLSTQMLRGNRTVQESSLKPPFDLASHLEIPKSKRPYTCSSCFKRFTHESNLIVHQRIHTGDRTYRCHECGKEFSRRTSLMVHIRTHTGEMPYQCRQCKRSFRQQSNLIYHLKTNSVQGVLSCSESTAAPGPQNCRGIAPQLAVKPQYPGDLNSSLHANLKARPSEVLFRRESPTTSKSSENLHISLSNVSVKPEPSDNMFNNLPHADLTSNPPQVPLTCTSNMNFKDEPSDQKFDAQSHVNFKFKPSQDIPLSPSHVDFRASEGMNFSSEVIDLTSSPSQEIAMCPSLMDIQSKPDSVLFSSSLIEFNSKVPEGQPIHSLLDITCKPSLEPSIPSPLYTEPKSPEGVHLSSSRLDFISDTSESIQSMNVVAQTSENHLISPLHVDIKSEPSEQQLINSSYDRKSCDSRFPVKTEPPDESLISASSLEFKPNSAENICYRPLPVDIKPEPGDKMVVRPSNSDFKSQPQANILIGPLQDSPASSFIQPRDCFGKQPLPMVPPQTRKRGRPRKFVKPVVQDGLLSYLTIHDPPVVIYKCEQCSKHFTHHSNLLSHHCTHLNEKKHQCQVCWKRFGHRTSLMVHMRTHTGEMPYECKQCGRRFRQQSNLLYHLKSHSSPSNRVQRSESFGHGSAYRACRIEPAREQLNGCLGIAKVQVYMDDRTYNSTVSEKNTAQQLDAQLFQRPHKRGRPRKYFKFKPCLIPHNNALSRQRVPMTKRPYRCRRCPKRFNHKSNLVVHQRIHTGELPYHCVQCDRSFRQQSNLSHHLKSHTFSVMGESSDAGEHVAPESCQNAYNGVVSLAKEELISPLGIDITTGLYVGRDGECDIGIGQLSEHPSVVEELAPCNNMLEEEDPVSQHCNSTEQRSFKCNECFKAFNHISNLIVHQRIHTGDKTYRCHECAKHFSQRTSLMVHLRTHTGEMPYQCMQCKRSFRQQSNLIYHHKSRTVQGMLMCKEGEEVPSHAGSGRSTQQSDKAETSEEAPTGPAKLEIKKKNDAPAKNVPSMHIETRQTRARVRLHEVCKNLEENSDSVSTSVGPTENAMYKCSECCKTFTHESNLIVHQRIHSGDRRYQCIQCNKEFSQRTSLMVHLRTHTGEMPYPCQQCGRSFRQQSNLIYHMKSHKMSSSANHSRTVSCSNDQSSFVNSDPPLPQDLKNNVSSEDMKKQELHSLHLPHRRPRGRPRKHVKLKPAYGVRRRELQCQ